MCGISGIFETSPSGGAEELGAVVRRMTDTLVHRGPDDSGVWVDAEAGIALGHRRLAIVDLSPSGHQPMFSADGRFGIVFNGEVYNFQSLRAELAPLGHGFRGTSDTEVMLAAIRQWGLAEALRRFVGMFAFALWDRQERTLSLVRDRLGVKPLYYGWAGSALVFGSELKAIRAHPAMRPEIDRDALALFLRYNCVPAPHSIYRGVFKLPPGNVLTLRSGDSRSAAPSTYWSAREIARRGSSEPFPGSVEDAVAELDALLRDAVRLRMIADVPLGAFLSGGIDSSTVVALMQAQSSRPVKTFTIGVHDAGYDEAEPARAVARHLRTEHTELYVEPSDVLRLVPKIPEWYDEPFADSSQLPTFLVSQMTRRNVTVALSGDGGDEVFAGYTRYSWARVLRLALGVPLSLRRGLAALLENVAPSRIDEVAGWLPAGMRPRLAGDKVHKAASVLRLTGSEEIYRRLVSHWQEPTAVAVGSAEPKNVLWDETLRGELRNFTQRMQLLDLVTYLPDDILTKVDRASMAVSLEARVPLLDHRVVDFAWRLPLAWKIRGGTKKWILRRILYRYVPRELVERPKMGFGIPIDSWLRGPLRDWAEDLLDERRLAADGYLSPGPIRTKWAEHLSGRRNWHYLLWDVLMFQAWKDRWMG
ncbi:MAG: asparagine synthase (glutamine-hydrolyzing) [Deltaproteobacteria bacterium]|nr:asparagine synthase (glutamine-hydrolyzing) [Deltaproteobacteria bacterium]